MVKCIINDDTSLFVELGGLSWKEISMELDEDKTFPLALAVIFGYKAMA